MAVNLQPLPRPSPQGARRQEAPALCIPAAAFGQRQACKARVPASCQRARPSAARGGLAIFFLSLAISERRLGAGGLDELLRPRQFTDPMHDPTLTTTDPMPARMVMHDPTLTATDPMPAMKLMHDPTLTATDPMPAVYGTRCMPL